MNSNVFLSNNTKSGPYWLPFSLHVPGSYLLLIQYQQLRSAEVATMVTFTNTTQVSPMGLRELPCVTPTMSPGLRRKKMLWQNAVKHIIMQQDLSTQVIEF